MLNYLKRSFGLTNKYIILATPLILFSLLSSLYILFSFRGDLINMLTALVLFIFMLAAFLSGWAYMLRIAVSAPVKDESNALIKEFPSGVGEYFLPALGFLFNVFVLSILILFVTYFAGMKFIGNIGISSATLTEAFESTTALKAFLMSLSKEQILRLNLWNLLILAATGIEYFLLMFHLPAIVFKCANPFKAFFISLKNLFSKAFLKNVLLYLIIFFSYAFLSILTTVFSLNIVTHFIFALINFYYLVFIAVLIFEFYYANFVQIGGKFDERV